MDKDLGAGQRKRCLIKIKSAMDLGVGQQPRINARAM
jgi:hypothetical protein